MEQLLAALAGGVAGVLAGFFGVGGNLVLVPLLSLLVGVGQHEAQGITLAALLPPLGLPAVLQYRRAGVPILLPVVGLAMAGFVGGVGVGSLVASVVPGWALRLAFAALLITITVRQLRGLQADGLDERLSTTPQGKQWWMVAAGLAGGFASGVLGIGGAIVMIPAFRWLGMGQRQAQANSLALLLAPLGLPGVLVYARAIPSMPWGLVVAVAVGFVLGALGGASLTVRIDPRPLARAFPIITGLAALGLVVRALQS